MHTIGTSHFISLRMAKAYYRKQGIDAAAVDEKLREGEIHISRPEPKPDESVKLDADGRYILVVK